MAGDYDTVLLGEVASVRSGFAFKSSDWTENGIPVVKIANVKDGRLVMDGCSFVPQSVADSAAEFALQIGDILIAMTGYIGDVAIVRESDLPAALNQRVGRFAIRDPRRLNQRFLFYLLRDADVRKEIENLGYGSAQPNVSPSLIHGVEVPLPPLPEQHAIAHILGTLDDKIELNRRMNETLEAMARALFKSWFVDFDPVRAKAEGRDPGLPKPLDDLFAARLVDSELGEIPEGWEIKSIGDLADVVGGTTPSTTAQSYWQNGTHAWATPKDLSALSVPVLLDTERRITDAGLSQIGSGLLPTGTVLLSSRAPIGYLAVAEIPVAINQGFIAMTPKAGTSNLFLLLWAGVAHDEIVSRANGSTFLEISKTNFRPIPVVTPSTYVMRGFEQLARPLYERIVDCARESHVLASLRDRLLPKLISGELRVGGA
jgi:type I restriction enzyme, S subunit